MASKEEKAAALSDAIKIAEAFARGGACTQSPATVLRDVYFRLVELLDETKD